MYNASNDLRIDSIIATIGLTLLLAMVMPIAAVDSVEVRGQVTNLGVPEFTWNPSSFDGFYYDIDKNLGAEQITFRLSDANPDNATLSGQPDSSGMRGITYTATAQTKNFKFKPWGQYEVIGFLGDRYFAAYNNTVTPTMNYAGESAPFLYDRFKNRNLMTNEQLSKVLIDSNVQMTITSASPLKLQEGYELVIKSIDANEINASVELMKDGKSVDSKIIHPSIANATMADKTYYYAKDIGDTKGLVVIAIHFKNVFHSTDTNLATIDGVFQLSDKTTSIKADQQYDKMSIRNVDPTAMTITMDNKDNPVKLSRNFETLLMQNIYVKAANQSYISPDNPLRYFIYEKYTDPGTYQLRGSVADLGSDEYTWDNSTFSGFYYDIDKNLGAERLTFRPTNVGVGKDTATLSDQDWGAGFRGITYTTVGQPKNFKFKPWGQYEVIGFLGERYFAAYNSVVTQGMADAGEPVSFLYDRSKNRNLMTNEQIAKILIDDDTERTITSGSSLKLEEGYELAIKSINVKGTKVYLELSKNGQVVDSSVIQPSIVNARMSDKTYYYKVDLGDTAGIVQIAVHFKNFSRNADKGIATIDGVFQISDTPTPLKSDQQYDKMSIRNINPTDMSITMDNKDDQITLSKNKDVILMQNIHIKTADQDTIDAAQPLRYYTYTLKTLESGANG